MLPREADFYLFGLAFGFLSLAPLLLRAVLHPGGRPARPRAPSPSSSRYLRTAELCLRRHPCSLLTPCPALPRQLALLPVVACPQSCAAPTAAPCAAVFPLLPAPPVPLSEPSPDSLFFQTLQKLFPDLTR